MNDRCICEPPAVFSAVSLVRKMVISSFGCDRLLLPHIVSDLNRAMYDGPEHLAGCPPSCSQPSQPKAFGSEPSQPKACAEGSDGGDCFWQLPLNERVELLDKEVKQLKIAVDITAARAKKLSELRADMHNVSRRLDFHDRQLSIMSQPGGIYARMADMEKSLQTMKAFVNGLEGKVYDNQIWCNSRMTHVDTVLMELQLMMSNKKVSDEPGAVSAHASEGPMEASSSSMPTGTAGAEPEL